VVTPAIDSIAWSSDSLRAQSRARGWPRGGHATRWSLVLASPVLNGLGTAVLRHHVAGLRAVVDWLESQPGSTWQDRWCSSGAEDEHVADWRNLVIEAGVADARNPHGYLGPGLAALICCDVVRPGIRCLLTSTSPRNLSVSLALARDPDSFAKIAQVCEQNAVGVYASGIALKRISAIMAAKGGTISEITVGDCLQVLRITKAAFSDGHRYNPFFYQLLHSIGVFGPEAPPTIRVFNTRGQRSVEELVDRYGITCRPVRDLLVDYLRERQARLDYSTLNGLSTTLAKVFWRDLELHHRGIASLRLDKEIAVAWKQRLGTRPARAGSTEGASTSASRLSVMEILATVRSFYLEIAEWAGDEPARWGPRAAPCPIRYHAISHTKNRLHRKSRMDQRTRERLPVLPELTARVEAERRAATERLGLAVQTPPGELFTSAGQTLRRSSHGGRSVTRVWAENPDSDKRRDLTLEEHRAFWAWAAIEVLRHTGIRIEELGELSHYDMIEYKLPTTGELVPLLHIVPSKTDIERLLVISPELADVLSTIICRVRGEDQTVPLVVAYDEHERTWLPPMPLLFQRRLRAEQRPIAPQAIRALINGAVERAGIKGHDDRSLHFSPHDFRRIFITDAIMHGMPPHIAQLVAGHRDINVTIGYKAVYPEEVINGHRAFIARRRALRPSEEYRTPTDEEWDEFLSHFERRRLSLGTCGRSYATACIHEHSCIRCPLLRPDPAQRPRLVEIEANLGSRIAEATREGWSGEVEGLGISLVAAREKLAQMDQIAARHQGVVHLGMPGSARTVTATRERPRVAGNPQ
jgi:integrase